MNGRLALKLVKAQQQAARKPGTWPASLGKPVDPLQVLFASRALSILHDMDVREPRGLTVDEARAVCDWHARHTAVPPRPSAARRAIAFLQSLRG